MKLPILKKRQIPGSFSIRFLHGEHITLFSSRDGNFFKTRAHTHRKPFFSMKIKWITTTIFYFVRRHFFMGRNIKIKKRNEQRKLQQDFPA